jgi:hypothetical protein
MGSRARRALLACAVLATTTAIGACTASTGGRGELGPPPPPAYPLFQPRDYAYTLTLACYCVDAGEPLRITVSGGGATDAVYLTDSAAGPAGTPAEDRMRVTINDIIGAANDPAYGLVSISWPAGQAYPSGVRLDPIKDAIDDEVGYTLSDVEVR